MPDLLADIAEAASMLTDSRSNSEPRWTWDASRNRKPLPPHVTTVPGLIQQLRDAEEPGSSGDGGGAGGGSLPLGLSALSLLGAITFGAAMRAKRWGVNLDQRTTPEEHIRGLVGLASRQSSGEQDELARELRSWRWQAEIVTGWRSPPRELIAPCPQCGARGTLLAYAHEDNPRARCLECGAGWAEIPREDEGSIRILAAHVTAHQKRSGLTSAKLRAEAVEARRRREGRVD
jgi:Zn ribbon nucleic-acid-binding protein